MISLRKALALLVVMGVALALAGAAAIPLTNHPKFCASCHTIEPSYDSWQASTHREVGCVECHVRPGVAGFLEDKVGAGLKDVATTVFGTPGEPHNLKSHVESAVCLRCHQAILRVSEIAERDLPPPVKGVGLIMSHRAHMKAFAERGKGEGCVTCHGRVVHGEPIKGYPIVIPRGHVDLDPKPYHPDFPKNSKLWEASLRDCMRCHDGESTYKSQVLSKRCETCHQAEKIGDFLF